MQLPNQLKTPAIVQKIQWLTHPVKFLENAAQKYPDIFGVQIFGLGGNIVFINHPLAIQEILTNDRKKYIAPGEHNGLLQPLLGNNPVIMLDGDRHRQRRKLVMPPFHGERMNSYGELIVNITKKVMDKLPMNQPFLARSAMQEISLQVILQLLFGSYSKERYQQLNYLMAQILQIFHSPFTSSFLFFPFLQKDLGNWSTWGKFLRTRNQIDKLLYAEIAERREKPDPNRVDILELLMSVQDEDGEGLSNQELRDELMGLLFTGHETTATAMSWALYWAYYLPETREKILKELATLGNSPNPVNIFRLPYLTAFCNEALRIYPVALHTFPRIAQEPTQILGQQIKTGTIVAACIYLLHQREDLYPQPKLFNPERFLERQFSAYEFMPFGGGARRCIGEALAVFEMKLVLTTILLQYQLQLADSQPEIPSRRGATLAPAKGVKMLLTAK